jgi:aspartate/methionine/tyrosine aminotransferase
MLSFSPHAGALAESETLAILARANRLRAEGVEVVSFAVGEPDFPTPAAVAEAGIRAIREGRTKYGPPGGILPLREAAARKFAAQGLGGAAPDRTMVGVGTKELLFLLFQVLLRDGDEVVLPAPCWLSYPKMVQAAGGRTVFVPTRAEDGYAIDPERLEAALTTRTRAVLLNSPCNPTGAVQPDEVQAEIGRIAARRGLLVVSDEIYENLVYEPARFRSFAACAPDAADLTVLVNGVSKAYAMTGWRIGFCSGPAELVRRMSRLQSHATSGPPEFCQRAALAAVEGPQDEVERMRRAFAERAKVMHRALAAIPGVSCRLPQGAFYLLPDCAPLLGRRIDGRVVRAPAEIAEVLLEKARVAVVPGEVFEAPTALRFSYACSREEIERGTARVAEVLGRLTA